MLVVEQPSSKLSTSTSPPLFELLYSRQFLLVYSRRLSPADLAGSAIRNAAACLLQTTLPSRPLPVRPAQSPRLEWVYRAGILSAVWWSIAVHSDNQTVTQFASICQIGDVPGVQDVKRHRWSLPPFRRVYACRYNKLQFLFGHHTKPVSARPHCIFSSIGENRGGSQFAHHTSRRIGKEAGFFQRITRCQRCRGTPITVSPAPVTSLTLPAPGLAYAAALYPICSSDIPCSERVTNRAEFVIGNRFHAALNNLFFGLTFTDNSFKFREIRR